MVQEFQGPPLGDDALGESRGSQAPFSRVRAPRSVIEAALERVVVEQLYPAPS
jgi:hypothetical protein